MRPAEGAENRQEGAAAVLGRVADLVLYRGEAAATMGSWGTFVHVSSEMLGALSSGGRLAAIRRTRAPLERARHVSRRSARLSDLDVAALAGLWRVLSMT